MPGPKELLGAGKKTELAAVCTKHFGSQSLMAWLVEVRIIFDD